MKWFKHYTDALDDPFIAELMDEFSHAGYVAWFGLIEIIAKENGHNLTGNLKISPRVLRRKLRSSQTKLRDIFEFCQTFGRLSFTFSQEKWEFRFPKMAEIKDNYTKDLQGAGNKPSNHKEVEVEVEVDKEKNFLSDSDEFRLSGMLLNEILKRNPTHKKPNLQSWAKNMDYLIRIDMKKPEEIKRVILWCQKDSFWQNNILSTGKLRDKYDELKLKMGDKYTNRGQEVTRKDPTAGAL